MRIVSRWAVTSTVTATAIARDQPMPSRPIARPLNTDVIANAMPLAVPMTPFARSCRSSGTSRVTVVVRATIRRLPAIAPTRMSVVKIQNAGSPRWLTPSEAI